MLDKFSKMKGDFIMIALLVIIVLIVLCSIKQINEYERGILFAFGKFKKILG